MIAVAGSAAAAITSKHEDDTWLSFTSTDLTCGNRLLKMGAEVPDPALGRRGDRFAADVGGLSMSLHPIGVLAVITADRRLRLVRRGVGIWISVQLKSTWRAQFLCGAVCS